jgi:4-hydroxythreonine-4-phosphate dehydrogenase
MAKNPIRIALTPGAENGVGPELLVRAVSCFDKGVDFFWCGDAASLRLACARASIGVKIDRDKASLATGTALVLGPDLGEDDGHKRQAQFLDRCVRLAKGSSVDAIVTGPIEKAALAHVMAGPFPGQTEYFAAHLAIGGDRPFMAFLGGPFMLSLLTTHLPVRKVADAITETMIIDHVQAVAKHGALLLRKPEREVNIAILGLNPHAGEGGLLGREELAIFMPAIKKAKSLGFMVQGPSPADGFFAYVREREKIPDVVVACYHDQGLSPYKLLSDKGAVNVTFGLSHVRVSPAHGTAVDLVGTGKADTSSTRNAIKIAIDLARHDL